MTGRSAGEDQWVLLGHVAGVHGLSGWVKNRTDGSVEIVAEGEEDDVKDFLSWSHNGPSTARVDAVDVRWRSYTGEYTDFRITR